FRSLIDLRDSKIKQDFDNRFESYLEYGLKENGLDYKRGNELKSNSASEKECDYLIDNFLYTECKAIEMKPLAQINPTDTILRNNLEHVIKAYQQILATANRNNKNGEIFGAIVTYLPFYFSDGTDAWNEFLKEPIEAFLNKHSYKLLIPPENLFFIDLVSWDLLMDVLKIKKITIQHLFSVAKNNNTKNKDNDRKFEFKMHLKPYLRDEIHLCYVDKLFEKISQIQKQHRKVTN
ncbi:MAG: hypothetical protein QQN41_12490, partial [Nitrosopumilus sp.]